MRYLSGRERRDSRSSLPAVGGRRARLRGWRFILFLLLCCPAGCNLFIIDNYEADVVWAEVEGEKLRMDICWPDSDEPLPMVLNFHSGGWRTYDKEIDIPLCIFIANRGYVVFNVNYRLVPEGRFPDQVNDVLGAVLWAKEHAGEYNGDPQRVALMGSSAGGNISAVAALAWNDDYFTPTAAGESEYWANVQALVSIYTIFDMRKMYDLEGFDNTNNDPEDLAEDYLGGSPHEVPENYDRASPVWYLDRAIYIPPTMIVCGDLDPLYGQSKHWKYELRERGVPYWFYTGHFLTHGFTNFFFLPGTYQAYDEIGDFLDEFLKDD